jgi:CubicO group peptidase (beta-lactamase class C family)
MFAINSAGPKAAMRHLPALLLLVLVVACDMADDAPDGTKVNIEKPAKSRAIPEPNDLPDIAFPCDRKAPGRCQISEFMEIERVCALLAIKNGAIRFMRFNTSSDRTICNEAGEPYEEDGVQKRYSAASVTKSITSTLLAQAIAGKYQARSRRDFERALRKPVDEIIPALGPETSNGGYAGVPLERVLQMRSGVRWKEAKGWFSDSDSFSRNVRAKHRKTIVEFARVYEPKGVESRHGRFNYSALDASMNSAITEALLPRNKKLSKFLEEGIWAELGMEDKGRWAVDKGSTAIGACCLSVRVRDLARFGMFILAKGLAPSDVELVPSAWFGLATKHGSEGEDEIPENDPSYNKGCPLDYRYQWWLRRRPATDFTAVGISGQFMHIYPAENAVVVQISDWGDWDEGDRRECESLKAHDALVEAMK